MNVSFNLLGLKRKRFTHFCCIFLACIGPIKFISAQSTLQVDLVPIYGYQNNIYGAANDIQFLGPDSLESDTVFVSDYFHEEQLNFGFTFENEKHKIKWENSAVLRTYRTLKAANTRNFQSRLNYNYHSDNWFVAGGQVRLGSYEEVGLDLISTDLLIPQSSTELFLRFSAGIQSEKNRLIFSPSFHRARYEPCLSCLYEESLPSLSFNEWNLALSDTVLIGNGSTQQKFSFGVAFGKQQFIDWENTLIIDPDYPGGSMNQFLPYDPDISYNLHQWSFFRASAMYSFPINENSRIVPFLNLEQRNDLGESDFGRNDLSAGMKLQYRAEKIKIDGNVSYSNQRFSDRLTGIEGNEARENLRYTLIQASATASYKIGGALYFHAGGMYASRASNELRTTTAVRRPYERWAFFGGLRIVFETERSAKK